MKKEKARSTLLLFAGFLSLLVWGCASNQLSISVETTLPPRSEGMCRIYFYQMSSYSSIAKPEIEIDGVPVGIVNRREFKFCDVIPGRHAISCSTDATMDKVITFDPNSDTYIRLNIAGASSFGIFGSLLLSSSNPQVISPKIGTKELSKCKYKL